MTLRRKEAAPPSTEEVWRHTADAAAIAVAHGGAPLTPEQRAYFEPRFGRDFSDVRIHTHGSAATAAHRIDARAYTLGSNIAFAPGEFTPGNPEGRTLIAHELAHTLQQTDGSASVIRRKAKGRVEPSLLTELLNTQAALLTSLTNAGLAGGDTSDISDELSIVNEEIAAELKRLQNKQTSDPPAKRMELAFRDPLVSSDEGGLSPSTDPRLSISQEAENALLYSEVLQQNSFMREYHADLARVTPEELQVLVDMATAELYPERPPLPPWRDVMVNTIVHTAFDIATLPLALASEDSAQKISQLREESTPYPYDPRVATEGEIREVLVGLGLGAGLGLLGKTAKGASAITRAESAAIRISRGGRLLHQVPAP